MKVAKISFNIIALVGQHDILEKRARTQIKKSIKHVLKPKKKG